jgi:DnaJ-class molecular chaperone
MAWQKCPICNGEGKLPNYGIVTSLFSVCPTCNGHRIIHEISGLPPAYEMKTTSNSTIADDIMLSQKQLKSLEILKKFVAETPVNEVKDIVDKYAQKN